MADNQINRRVAGAGGDTTLSAELVSSHDLVTWRRLHPGTPFLPRSGDSSGAADACSGMGDPSVKYTFEID